jgi:hypothetical protein
MPDEINPMRTYVSGLRYVGRRNIRLT